MKGSRKMAPGRARTLVLGSLVTLALLATTVASVGLFSEPALADRGPAYSGTQTQPTGPAFFGPAPNPFPYCESPTYFDPFPENVTPIGRMDIGDTASVSTDGLTMDLVITAEGNPGTQYPGFFPFDDGVNDDGRDRDQPKGIEMAEGDGAGVTLGAPLFYSQWIFTDVDQPDEGFTVTPRWTQQGQAAAFGGDDQFTFANSNSNVINLDDTDGQGTPSQAIEGRVQVDFLGAVTGIDMLRAFPSDGQSGFAVGGGCEAAGAAKVVVAGPTWNGTSFDVTYELRMRNNLPSSQTIQDVIADAQAAVGTSFVSDTPAGIDLSNLQLTDDLTDDSFSDIVVTDLSTTSSLVLNDTFDGLTDIELLDSGSIPAEEDALITLSVAYTPDLASGVWGDCSTGYVYDNQSQVTGTAAGVDVADTSDDGVNASPGDNNGAGGVDDPTLVTFPCPPGDLEIVKTALAGSVPTAECPDFDAGIEGDGTPVQVTAGDQVTFCITVRNPLVGPAFNVQITDPQGPGDFNIGTLLGGESETVSYEITAAITTPPRNIATTAGNDVDGALGPVNDPALINVNPINQPNLEIVKTALVGPDATCPDFDGGTPDEGAPVDVVDAGFVTFCISVRNTGPGTATDVVVSDPQAPSDFAIGTLTTDQVQTVQYDLPVTPNMETLNLATANGNGPTGALAPVDDPARINVVLRPNPLLEIVKTALVGPDATCPDFDGGTLGDGAAVPVVDAGTVTFCISVRNIGLSTATNVVVSDPQAPGDFDIGTLASGEGDTVQYDLPVTPNMETTNVATANGSGPNGPLTPVDDPALIVVNLRPDPVLEIVKTAIVGPTGNCPAIDAGTPDEGAAVSVLDGGFVTYCISVRNLGPGDATNVIVTDPQGPGDFDIGTLTENQAQTVQYDLPVTPNMETTNVATANGSGPNGSLTPVDDPAVIVVQLRPDPVLEIVKTALRGPTAQCPAYADGVQGPGDPVQFVETEIVTYCLTVLNSGLGDATNVVVTDTQAPNAFDLNIGDLAAGDQQTLQYDLEVFVSTPATNTAGVTGQGINGPVDPDQDDAIINVVLRPDPVLEIVKTVIAGPNGDCPDTFDEAGLGDGDALPVLYTETVTYCIVVRNTGLSDATSVTVTDPAAPGVFQIGVLPAGESISRAYDVVVDDTTPEQNTATVNGSGPNGVLDPVDDTALIDPSPQPDPVLEIVKTAIAGPMGDCPAFDDGVPDEGTPLPRLYTETVTFCISIRNSGPTTATAVVINDDQAPGPFDIGTLQPNQEETVSYDVIVDADTPENNVATATGVGPNGDLPPASDPAVINPSPQPEPELEIVKTVVAGPDGDCPTFENGTPGQGDPLDVELFDVVTYCIALRNIGAGDAENVKINDDQSPDSPYDIGDLASGAGTAVSYDVEVTADGSVINTAAATGTGPTGPIDQVEDDAIINVTDSRVANISLIHSVSVRGEDCITATKDLNSLVANIIGTEVTWCAEITNTGNVPLTNVVLNAPEIGVTGVDALAAANAGPVLLPGESVVIALDGVIVASGLLSDGSVAAQPSDAAGNPSNLAPVDDADTAETREASIDLQTTVVEGVDGDCTEATEIVTINAGQDVTWCFLVTNTGTVDLLVEEVTDVTLGITVEVPVDQQKLLPGGTILVKTSSTATSDLVNEAEVAGQPLDLDGTVLDQAPIVQDSDPAEINTPTADLAITKAVSDRGPVAPNTTLTYTLTVENLGPDRAEDVSITDSIPAGLEYVALPVVEDWECEFDDDRRGFSCLKQSNMESGETVDFVYDVTVTTGAASGVGLVNTATVDSPTPDPDETNNEDTERTEREVPDTVIPRTELPEYPGPFTLPEPPDEVLGLAITGAQSRLLGLFATALLAVGGTMLVGSRRRKEDNDA